MGENDTVRLHGGLERSRSALARRCDGASEVKLFYFAHHISAAVLLWHPQSYRLGVSVIRPAIFDPLSRGIGLQYWG